MRQCAAAVPESCYASAHRCCKKKNLASVAIGGAKVQICRHHVAVLERKGTLELWKSAASFN